MTFYAKVGNGDYKSIGTDDTRPYRVYHDVSSIPDGTDLSYRAVVRDNAGHTRLSERERGVVPKPELTIKLPAEGAGVFGADRGAGAGRSGAGDARGPDPAAGGHQRPVDHGPDRRLVAGLRLLRRPDRTLPVGTTIQYRAILNEPDGTRVVSAVRTVNRVAAGAAGRPSVDGGRGRAVRDRLPDGLGSDAATSAT